MAGKGDKRISTLLSRKSVVLGNEGDIKPGEGWSLDNDQQKKYEEIIELLLAAGYFRARISSLSPFDKVVGGMCWCISASNYEVDVDLFFQEEATIGQKIKISDAIVQALVAMKSPVMCQSHQIQGSDFISIYPVIQWLVKKVIETRKETGDLLRAFSEAQFNKSYQLPQDAEFEQRKKVAGEYVKDVNLRYHPKRSFRRTTLMETDEETQVQSALLEFGGSHLYRINKANEDKKKQNAASKKLEDSLGSKEDEEAAAAERRLKQMMGSLSSTEGRMDLISGKMVGSLVGLDSEKIREAASLYDSTNLEGMDKRLYGEEMHKRQVESKKRQITAQKSKFDEGKKTYLELREKVESLQNNISEQLALQANIKAEIEKLDQLETPENLEILKRLKDLVSLNDSLKNQANEFKANCKRHMQELKDRIQALKSDSDPSDDEERQRIDNIDETLQKDTLRLQKLRQLLGKTNRDIAAVERKIDDIPSRIELQQYQRQFVELYEQVASKLIETKRYYLSYNTLSDKKNFLSKEVSILNSIYENYGNAISSKSTKEALVDSMDSIVKNLKENKEKLAVKVNDEKKIRDELNEKYLSLLEKERLYYKLTKDFELECQKNEQLLAKLAS